MSKNVIYCLIDPRTGELKYVGKTVKGGKIRYREHISLCNLKNDNSYKANWIKKLLKLNLKPELYILEYHENHFTLDEAEEFYIEYFKSIGCKLTNSNKGGKGTVGFNHREETKELIGNKAKNRDQSHLKKYQIKKENKIIDGIETRQCFDCKIFIPLINYSITKMGIYYSYCKFCSNIRKQKSRVLNPEKLKYIKLSPEEYKKSRSEAGRKGALAVAKDPLKVASVSKKMSKPVIATSCSSSEILEFPSALKAKESGFHNKLIGDAIKSKRPYKGYYWKLKIKV